MKTSSAIFFAIILLLASISARTVFAQGGGDDGYPVDDGYPIETTEPPDPTPDPPDPTPEPTQPTPEPTRPAPEPTDSVPPPTAPTPDPTQEPANPYPICSGTNTHPVIRAIAEYYYLDYEELLAYFCKFEFGDEEINWLTETFNQAAGKVPLGEILSMRIDKGLSWAGIWAYLD